MYPVRVQGGHLKLFYPACILTPYIVLDSLYDLSAIRNDYIYSHSVQLHMIATF